MGDFYVSVDSQFVITLKLEGTKGISSGLTLDIFRLSSFSN